LKKELYLHLQIIHFMLKRAILYFFSFLALSANSQSFNKIEIDSNTLNDFSMIDSTLKNKRVIMLGENHLYRKSNYKLEFKMLKHVNKHHGVDHLLLEFGYSIGWLADTYIQTGDSSLKSIIADYFYPEFNALFDSIRILNSSLDTNLLPKVRVSSIDIERSLPIAAKIASLMLPIDTAHHPHDSIAFHIETLRSLASYSDRVIRKSKNGKLTSRSSFGSGFYEEFNFLSSIKPIIENVKKYPLHYEEYLGEECIHFLKIFKGLEKAIEWNDYLDSKAIQYVILREEYLYNSFISYLAENPNSKVLMQFGRCHAMPSQEKSSCAFDAFKSLAYRIKHSSNKEVKGKIFTLPILYLNSYADGFSDDYTVAKHILDKTDFTLKKGELFLYQNAKDSLVESYFPGFDYFIINTNYSADDQIIDKTDSIDEGYYEYRQHVTDFGIESGFVSYTSSFKDISNVLKLPLPFYSFTNYYNVFLDYQDSFGFLSFNVFGTTPQTIIKDSATYDLSSFGLGIKLGTQLLSMDRKGMLSIAIGNAFQSLTLGETIDLNWKSNSIFDNSKTSNNRRKITNPAYVLSLDVRAKYKLGRLLLGVHTGYNLDVSSKYWRSKNGLISDGPRNSLSAFYFGGSLSFQLNKNRNSYY
jgi:hypothetical protein